MKPANKLFATLLTDGRKANLQILTNLKSRGESLQLIKDQIKSKIMYLLHKIIDDGANCFVDNKRLMK